MQILIITFAGTHAYNGLRNILEDYLGHGFFKVLLRGLIFLLWLASLLLAIYVILAS
jgi:succinate dehydrogenase hydrophobic anchor subunit